MTGSPWVRRAIVAAACMAAGGCTLTAFAHEGLEDTWTTVDAVFLERNNQSTDTVLAANSATGDAIITAGQLTFPTQPGLRLFHGRVDDCGTGWEVGYLGVWNMFAQRQVPGLDNIQAPDPLASLPVGLDAQSLARATYASTLNSAEANWISRYDDGGFNRSGRYPWQRCENYCRGTHDWLLGFRWAGLDESATLALSGGSAGEVGRYGIQSSTNLFGMQLGRRGRLEWQNWALEGWAKAALAGSAMSQSTAAIPDAITPSATARPGHSATEGGVGFIGDIATTLTYRIDETWGLRMGYNLIWLSGVALAPSQYDFGASATSGSGLAGGGGVFLHGASLGLEASW
jgi:hypothetical protein